MPAYIPLPDDPRKMTRAEMRQHLDGAAWSLIMRSLLMFEIERVRSERAAGELVEARTLRSLWYTLVKPALEKLGALEQSYYTRERVTKLKDVGKIPDWAGLLSKYLSQLVETGVTSYEELAIIDGSRQRRRPLPQVATLRQIETVGVHYPNILLFTEKDTIYQVVEALASIYGVSCLSGGGQPSYAATENLIKQMVKSERFFTGQSIIILTLTDYDPAGYTISQALIDQVAKVAGRLPQVANVTARRLGLSPAQLSSEERAANVYTPAPNGLRAWFKETGGVDGQPLGLELDALPIARIRQLFIDGLQAVIPSEKKYHRDLGRSLVELLIWEAMEEEIEARRAALYEAIDGSAVATRLSCRDDLIAMFAAAGFGQVNPLEYDQHCFNAADEIRGLLQVAKTD